jgi:hypothetical protein
MNNKNNSIKWDNRIGVTFYDPTRGISTLFGSTGKCWEKIFKSQVVGFAVEGIFESCDSTLEELDQRGVKLSSLKNFAIETKIVELYGNRKYLYWEFLVQDFIKIASGNCNPDDFNITHSTHFTNWLKKRIMSTHFYDSNYKPLLSRGYPHQVDILGYEPYENEFASEDAPALAA